MNLNFLILKLLLVTEIQILLRYQVAVDLIDRIGMGKKKKKV